MRINTFCLFLWLVGMIGQFSVHFEMITAKQNANTERTEKRIGWLTKLKKAQKDFCWPRERKHARNVNVLVARTVWSHLKADILLSFPLLARLEGELWKKSRHQTRENTSHHIPTHREDCEAYYFQRALKCLEI